MQGLKVMFLLQNKVAQNPVITCKFILYIYNNIYIVTN